VPLRWFVHHFSIADDFVASHVHATRGGTEMTKPAPSTLKLEGARWRGVLRLVFG
jgi:hypothetical protein